MAPPQETTLAVVREAEAIRAGTGDPQRLLAEFRAATLIVCRQIDPPAFPVITVAEMGCWVQVFTSVQVLTAAVGAEHEYMTLSGAEVLDVLLPFLDHGTGVLLDPGTPHMLPLPPVAPIVADFMAVQLEPTNSPTTRAAVQEMPR